MSNSAFHRIALEGPCCAGKTTLAKKLLAEFPEDNLSYVLDYSTFVGGGRFLPSPAPNSLADEQASLEKYLGIEADRIKHLHCAKSDITLIDRSVHSLLAHSYALEKITGIKYFYLTKSILYNTNIPLWPETVFYVDIPNEEAKKRNLGKFADNSIFMSPDYNRGLLLYFQELANVSFPDIIWLDGTLDPMRLGIDARECLRRILHSNPKEQE